MNSKKWVRKVIFLWLTVLFAAGVVVVWVDPFFHYHAPLHGVYYSYGSGEDVYINDGIAKNFSYNAVVTGTSMTLNFKTEEINELFDVEAVRLTFLGEGFKVINDTLETAVRSTPNLELVIRGIDDIWFISDADWKGREEYPDYLYDENIFNDVYYLYNVDVWGKFILPDLEKTLKRAPLTGQDDWGFEREENAGIKKALENYDRPPRNVKIVEPEETAEFYRVLQDNLKENVQKVIENNPQIQFYLFFPPYSICWWDSLNQGGTDVLKRRIDLEKYVIETLLQYDNVRLFSFHDNFELTTDMNNYKDEIHYYKEVNSQILQWMKKGEYELTWENYQSYLQRITDFYCGYNYDAIFEGEG